MFDLDGYIRFGDIHGLHPQPQKKLPVVYKWLFLYEGLRLSKQTTNIIHKHQTCAACLSF